MIELYLCGRFITMLTEDGPTAFAIEVGRNFRTDFGIGYPKFTFFLEGWNNFPQNSV